MRSQERQKRYAAQKKAQELLVKQRLLQQQRGVGAYGQPIIQEVQVQRTPIIKNGKIIGYGIPITDPSQLVICILI